MFLLTPGPGAGMLVLDLDNIAVEFATLRLRSYYNPFSSLSHELQIVTKFFSIQIQIHPMCMCSTVAAPPMMQ